MFSIFKSRINTKERKKQETNPEVLSNSKGKSAVPVLAGSRVFLTMKPDLKPDGMISIGARSPFSWLSPEFYKQKKKGAQGLFLYADEAIAKNHSKAKLAADAYLRIGFTRSALMMRRPLILIGGDIDDRPDRATGFKGTNLEFLIFRNNQLVKVQENQLPAMSNMTFEDVLDKSLVELKSAFPDAIFEQCAPLPRLKHPFIKRYYTPVWLRLAPQIELHPKKTVRWKVMLGMLALLLPAAAYSWILMVGLAEHQAKVQEGQRLAQQIRAESSGLVGIETLKARAVFKRQSEVSSEKQLTPIFELIAATKSLRNAQIQRIESPASSGATLSFEIAIPREGEALEQGEALIVQLASKMKGQFRIPQGGYADASKDRRFRIEVEQ